MIHSHLHHPCLEFHMIQTTSKSVIQDKSLQEINIEPIQDFIHQLTAKFFDYCPSNPNPPVQ